MSEMTEYEVYDEPEQAAESAGAGCLTVFTLPLLAIAVIGGLLAFFALRSTLIPASALRGPKSLPGAPVPIALTGATPELPAATTGLPALFTPEVQAWAAQIIAWSAAAGVDPSLAATVMQIESCGDPRARSRSGAMGLFQVMPYHFAAGEDPYDPTVNATRGLGYLRRALDVSGGDADLALAGYNGGVGIIERGRFTWAAETLRYFYWGSGIYADAVSGAAESPRLQEWLAAGGASLCSQAHSRLGLP